MHRKTFLQSGFVAAASYILPGQPVTLEWEKEPYIMTVTGAIKAGNAGFSLSHEHILVDFIGADKITPGRYEAEKVINKALPFLKTVYQKGCKTLVDCTPPYLGRDVVILQKLSKLSGLQIITSTGYYAAAREKYVPAHAFTETAQQLANRWIREFENGIDGTSIKPGLIKTGVDQYPLSAVQQKLIEAAALTHLSTGLTIGVHTGNGAAALEEMKIITRLGVNPAVWIWIHAQSEADRNIHIEVGNAGGWVSFDGLNDDNIPAYVKFLKDMQSENLLHSVLISHDAGWYNVGDIDGGNYRGYNTVFDKLIPALKKSGFTEDDIQQVFVINPAKALAIQKRKA